VGLLVEEKITFDFPDLEKGTESVSRSGKHSVVQVLQFKGELRVKDH
jgi:hypothetical protein